MCPVNEWSLRPSLIWIEIPLSPLGEQLQQVKKLLWKKKKHTKKKVHLSANPSVQWPHEIFKDTCEALARSQRSVVFVVPDYARHNSGIDTSTHIMCSAFLDWDDTGFPPKTLTFDWQGHRALRQVVILVCDHCSNKQTVLPWDTSEPTRHAPVTLTQRKETPTLMSRHFL